MAEMSGGSGVRDPKSLVEQSYQELCEELDPTEASELVMPTDLTEPTDYGSLRENDARTVVIDAQGAAMDYAIASSLYPHVRVSTPPEGAEREGPNAGLKIVKGRMSEPPPLARPSEPIKIVKGSKIPK